jgi:hypothetical protein
MPRTPIKGINQLHSERHQDAFERSTITRHCSKPLVAMLEYSHNSTFDIQSMRLAFDAEQCPPPINPLKQNFFAPDLILVHG